MKIDYQVKNADELIDIERQEYRTCVAMDLLFMRGIFEKYIGDIYYKDKQNGQHN